MVIRGVIRCFILQVKQTGIDFRAFDNLMYLSKNHYNVRFFKVKPMFNANSIKPGIAGLANPLRKCMQSGVF